MVVGRSLTAGPEPLQPIARPRRHHASKVFDAAWLQSLRLRETRAVWPVEVPAMPVPFPSREFFETLRDAMRADRERFSRLGFFDTTFGVRVLPDGAGTPTDFALTFEVFDLTVIHDSNGVETDFVLEGRLAAWRDM